MCSKNNVLDFRNQVFFIGMDVHKRNWSIKIRNNDMVLKKFSMNPDPKELYNYMQRNYPNGEYRSCYEAGFSGYWAHRELTELGIKNIVVNAADVPSSNKEKNRKTDPIDAGKLARELEKNNLKGIYIPDKLSEELRSLSRQRYQAMKDKTRIKNRIKSYLAFYGHKIPENYQVKNWSGGFIEQLRQLEFNYPIGKDQLNIYLEQLIETKSRMLVIIRQLRQYIKQYGKEDQIKLLMSIPGVGYTTAVTFLTELIDINRFKGLDGLCAYVGLVPSIYCSGEKEKIRGLSQRHNKYLRSLIIEDSWVAVHEDPALTMSFNELIKRMKKQEAIIRIAKKLLSRMYFVLKNQTEYTYSVVK
jgi:transposase